MQLDGEAWCDTFSDRVRVIIERVDVVDDVQRLRERDRREVRGGRGRRRDARVRPEQCVEHR